MKTCRADGAPATAFAAPIGVTDRALDFADLSIPLSVRRSAAARRISLRIDPSRRAAVLTLPPRATLQSGLGFVAEKALWLRHAYQRLPAAVPFAAGAVFPLYGRPHRISHRPDLRGGAWREGDTVVVTGAAEHLPRRLTDWLKREALAVLEASTRAKAARIDRAITRVALRDTRSRWGSCSRDGRVHYSWRLILAPDFVADYVVAHEVAHLLHMSHGPRFRTAVDGLTPHRAEAEAWLRVKGSSLLLVGASFG